MLAEVVVDHQVAHRLQVVGLVAVVKVRLVMLILVVRQVAQLILEVVQVVDSHLTNQVAQE
jgi:hypothetical protein